MKHPSAPKLLLIGKRPYKKHSDDYENIAALVKELGLQDRVVFAGYLPDEDLAYFYRRAVGYVFPSRYEGFGIPILEAFYSATPVIVATGSALTEIGGEAVLYFNPDDVDTLASHMDIIAGSEAIRLEMVAMGRIELRKYSWEKSGKEFLELARKLTYSA
jgi:glycosyltransferase involved in cell wall biosynthesis